jgi:hypothetical protein
MAARWAAEAQVTQTQQKYFVLLMITDGGVSDFADAVEAIVEASRLPLSVLVAGVGDGNFGRLAQMNEGDDGLAVDSQGRAAVRDICRFVPLRAVGSNASALSVSETPPLTDRYIAQLTKTPRFDRFAQERLLSEVPGQMLEYMQQHGILPGTSFDEHQPVASSPQRSPRRWRAR